MTRKWLTAAAAIGLIVGNVSTNGAAEPVQLVGHTDPVYSVDVSADGKWIVTGSFDKTLRLWEADSLKVAGSMTGHTGIVLTVAFSRDGKRIASGSLDKTIRIWEVPSSAPTSESTEAKKQPAPKSPTTSSAGKNDKSAVPAIPSTVELKGHGSNVYGVAFSPDGKLLASVSDDKTVRLWDIEQKKLLKTLATLGGAVYCVAFSPDGKSLLTGSADKTVRLFDVVAGNEIRQYNGPEFPIYTVGFSSDGSMIAAAGVGLGANRKVFLWNVENRDAVKVIEKHRDDVYRVQFNPQGTRLLTAGYSGSINVWDVASGKALFSTDLPIIYSACYSSDGKRIIVAASDNTAYLLDVPAAAQ